MKKTVINFDKLFEPIKIGNVEIKNRLALAPINGEPPYSAMIEITTSLFS
jgi:hypothetical protein